MSTVTVSNTNALLTALNSAHAGDTILLAPGSYARLYISNYNKGGAVNIQSANSTNQAVLNGFTITNSSGLNISNVVLSTATFTGGYPYWVSGSSNINLTKLNVGGTLDTANGLYLSGDNGVTVTQSVFQHLVTAITDGNNSNVKIENNSFSNLATDGIDNTAVSNVIIAGNTFTDFQPAAGVHPDAIQFWTTNQAVGSSNVTITGNTVTQGAGAQAQGIFLTDQAGNLPYQNVIITNNTITGGLWNGIYLEHAKNAVISGNTLTSVVDPTVSNPALSRLIAFNITNGVIANNTAAQYYLNAADTGLSVSNNATDGYLTLGGAAASASTAALTAVATLASAATSASVAASTGAPLMATAMTQYVNERQSVSGSVVMTDSAGGNPIVAEINGRAVAAGAAGSTFNTGNGVLVMHQNGTYTYTATKEGLTVGQIYVDTITAEVTDSHGHSTNVLMSVTVTGSATGTAAANTIVAGSGAETIEGLGGADSLISGTGPDTFVYTALTDSTPTAFDTITGFKAGDIIDLSAVDPSFHVVSAFDHHANELMIVNDGSGAWDIYGDTTGSGAANFKIHLTGATTPITAASLHL